MEVQKFYNPALDEEMQFVTHESGLRVYVFPKKGFSKYYAIYGTEYGSIDREFVVPGDEKATVVPDGIAHYLEHKLFEEADGSNAFDRFAKTGASSNAFTSFDLTAYLFTCTDKFYENLDILLNFVNHPHFTDENVQKEQGIIGQEIKMYEDDPEWRVFFNTLCAMYHKNPVKIDIAGTVESISHITPEILYKCYNTFYNPSNMILVMVGDVDMEKALKYVDKHVDVSRDLGKIKRPKVSEPSERAQEIITQKLVVSRPLFHIGFKETNTELSGSELLKNEIATNILLIALFGKSSDFYMSLYSEGLIDSSFSDETELEKPYGFTLFGGESSEYKEVYSRIKNYITETKKSGLPQKSIERARKILKGQNIRGFNSVENMGNDFIRRLLNGINPLEYAEAIDQVTYRDLEERFAEHFNVDNCVLSVVEPND